MHLYTGCSNVQLIFIHLNSVGPQNRYPLGPESFGCLSNEGTTLLGISEVIGLEDLNFAVLLDESDDGDTIVRELCPKDGRNHA